MRGKQIKAIAKRNVGVIIKEGEEVIVQSILYDEPKLLVNALGGLYENDQKTLIRMIPCYKGIYDKEIGEMVQYQPDGAQNKWATKHYEGLYMCKMFEASYAPAGSYKDSVIIKADGHEMPSSLLNRPISHYFEKI